MMKTQRLSLCAASLASLLFCAAAPFDSRASAPQSHSNWVQVASLFGESDEEREARLAREQKERDQDAAISNLNAQLRDMEETVRRLTGQNEVLSHKVEQFDSRVDRMQKDFDYKLCTVTAQQVGGDTASLPCGSDGTAPTNSYAPPPMQSSTQSFDNGDRASASPRTLAPPPGVIGSLPRNTPLPQQGGGQPPDGTTAIASPYQAEFDTGLSLLGKAQYDGARASFRAFADDHPKDGLAPEAVFWVGNIAYVQKDYSAAALSFGEGIKKYPNSRRASESMFKLGRSLIAMGKKKEGCFTLAALPSTYPKTAKATLAQAAAASKDAGCK